MAPFGELASEPLQKSRTRSPPKHVPSFGLEPAPEPAPPSIPESPPPPIEEPYKRRRRYVKHNLSSSSTQSPMGPVSPAWSVRSGDVDPPDWWTLDLLDGETHEPVRIALEELKKYYEEYSAASKDPFWCRKSGKVVLSVVICRRENEAGFVAHRGMNTEVSLPAGSLCAERSAISRAATDFHSASSIVSIAVVDPGDELNPLWPCEVCQSWLSKLRPQSPEIAVVAVNSLSFESFAVRVNGEYQSAPRLLPQAALDNNSNSSSHTVPYWPANVVVTEGTNEMPWEARELVYVDGAWTFLHSGQLSILREARSRGSHLMVGVHSDAVLREEFDMPVLEPFETRLGRILQNRHVSSVLKDAPWNVTSDMIDHLGIKIVITGSVSKARDGGKEDPDRDPYRVAREASILQVVPSLDDTTERSIHEELRHADLDSITRI